MIKRLKILALCTSPLLVGLACTAPTTSQQVPASTASAPANAASGSVRAKAPAPAVISSSQTSFAGDRQPANSVHAVLMTTNRKSKDVGSLQFVVDGDKVTIAGTLEGLPQGTRAIKILDSGDCDALGSRVADFNPTMAKHGPLDSSERHVGDLGNIVVAKTGQANFELTTDSLTVKAGAPSSVLGRIIVVTRNKDDGKSQPDGRAGKAIACGKIVQK